MILNDIHGNGTTGGHIWEKRTQANIAERFYWRTITEDVTEFVSLNMIQPRSQGLRYDCSYVAAKTLAAAVVGVDVDFHLCEEDKLRNGRYHIVFTHPEAFISTKYGRELLMTKIYKDNVVTIVVDEAHCILEW